MKHTIYLTSGQTAEFEADEQPAIVQYDVPCLVFKRDGLEVAKFPGTRVAGHVIARQQQYPVHLTPSEGVEWITATYTHDTNVLSRLLDLNFQRECKVRGFEVSA